MMNFPALSLGSLVNKFVYDEFSTRWESRFLLFLNLVDTISCSNVASDARENLSALASTECFIINFMCAKELEDSC